VISWRDAVSWQEAVAVALGVLLAVYLLNGGPVPVDNSGEGFVYDLTCFSCWEPIEGAWFQK
jgi:hypothetical protein